VFVAPTAVMALIALRMGSTKSLPSGRSRVTVVAKLMSPTRSSDWVSTKKSRKLLAARLRSVIFCPAMEPERSRIIMISTSLRWATPVTVTGIVSTPKSRARWALALTSPLTLTRFSVSISAVNWTTPVPEPGVSM